MGGVRAKNPQFTAANATTTPSDEQVRCRVLATSTRPKCQPSLFISLAAQSRASSSSGVSRKEEKRREIRAAIGPVNRTTDTSSCPRNF